MGIGSFKYELSSQTPQGRACNTIFITNSDLQVKQILFGIEPFVAMLASSAKHPYLLKINLSPNMLFT
jgi:hypothetical protein